jgi:hypothetical protein
LQIFPLDKKVSIYWNIVYLLLGDNSSFEGIPKRSIVCNAFSQIIHCFSPKEYPGMTESSELIRCFASQGLPMPIRKMRQTDIDSNQDSC